MYISSIPTQLDTKDKLNKVFKPYDVPPLEDWQVMAIIALCNHDL